MADPKTLSDDDAPHVQVEHRFATIPEALLYDTAVPAEAVRVYGVLLRHGSDPSNCFPSYKRIGKLIGKSARSVPAWVKALEEAGWIERVARTSDAGDPDSNGYRVFAVPGVRAGERIPLPAGERGGSTPHSAPKESKGKRASSNEDLAPAVAAASLVKATDDPLTKTAHDLAVLAFEQEIKPLAAGGFPTVMARLKDTLRAGFPVRDVRAAIEAGPITWTDAGVTTAVAKVKRARGKPLEDRLDANRRAVAGG